MRQRPGEDRVRLRLTEAGVDEAVPHAAVAAVHPAAPQAGREAERGAADADQHVADADVEQQHVDGSPQSLEPAEQDQDQQVVEEAEHHDGAQEHRHHAVTAARQPLLRRVAPVLVRGVQRLAQVPGLVQVAHLGEHVGTSVARCSSCLCVKVIRGVFTRAAAREALSGESEPGEGRGTSHAAGPGLGLQLREETRPEETRRGAAEELDRRSLLHPLPQQRHRAAQRS